jgi:leukotriene-A4 hydrolase
MYYERLGVRRVIGEELELLLIYNEHFDLNTAIREFGEDSPLTALEHPVSHENPDNYYSIIPYYKGGLFLYTLEKLFGQEPFLEFMRTFLRTHRLGNITTEHFRAALQAMAGPRWEQVRWDDWVMKTGFCPV